VFETPAVRKQLSSASREHGLSQGLALTILNEPILIAALPLQEARRSSQMEDVVTTQDDLYRLSQERPGLELTGPIKEVAMNAQAL